MTPSRDSFRAARRIYEEFEAEGYDQPARLRNGASLLRVRGKADPEAGAGLLWELWHTGPSQDWSREQKIEAGAQMIEEMK